MKPDFKLLQGQDSLTTYRFGSNTAGHAFCKLCGINMFNMLPDGHPPAPVNARSLEGIDIYKLDRKPQKARIELPDGTVVEKVFGGQS